MLTSTCDGKFSVVLLGIVMVLTVGATKLWAEIPVQHPKIEISTDRSGAGIDLLVSEPAQQHELNLISGKSIVLKTDRPIDRVAVASPEIADYLRLSPRELYITGKTGGVTNLILWQGDQVISIYDVRVTYDLSSLKKELFLALPKEKDIHVIRTQDSIALSGRVSSNANLSRVLSMAQAYAPEGKVVNLLEVGGVHQVMLEVRLAEMARSTSKQLGIDVAYSWREEFGVSMLAGLQQLVSPSVANVPTGPLFGILTGSAVKALFRFQTGETTWTAMIDALKEDGMAKILAEPTLISLSGQTASFLAGGEFPIPVPNEDGITIVYKKFGVQLSFTPTVLSPEKINISVDSGVSQLDFTTAVKYGGYVVPGITTRNTNTVVELGDGQSFAIAGLLQENIREESSKYPFLGDIPILGALFRSTSFQKDETELVIVVTPRLVKPMEVAGITLPTDFYREPTDMEFYFNFKNPEKEASGQQKMPVTGTLDGDFGHSFSDSE